MIIYHRLLKEKSTLDNITQTYIRLSSKEKKHLTSEQKRDTTRGQMKCLIDIHSIQKNIPFGYN